MARLRAASLRDGVSISQLIREAVDRALPDDEWQKKRERALAAIGCLVDEPEDDVARRHDDYLVHSYQL